MEQTSHTTLWQNMSASSRKLKMLHINHKGIQDKRPQMKKQQLQYLQHLYKHIIYIKTIVQNRSFNFPICGNLWLIPYMTSFAWSQEVCIDIGNTTPLLTSNLDAVPP